MEIHSCPLAGLLIFHSLNVCSQSSEFTNQILVAPFNVVDILHKSLPLGSQARNHQGSTGAQIMSFYRCAMKLLTASNGSGLTTDLDFCSHGAQLFAKKRVS